MTRETKFNIAFQTTITLLILAFFVFASFGNWLYAISSILLASILFFLRLWLKGLKRGGLGRQRREEKCR